jgi:hypothetical protein
LPENILNTIKTSQIASVRAVKTAHWLQFQKDAEKEGREITPEIEEKLHNALDEITIKAPAFLEGGKNWFEDAETWLTRRDPEYRRSLEKAAIEREKKRQQDTDSQGEHFDGGAKAGGGKESDAMKELKKKLGAKVD